MPLLVATRLREAHMTLLLTQANGSLDHQAAVDAATCIEGALDLAKHCDSEDAGLVPELLVQFAHAQSDSVTCLLSAISAVTQQQFDHHQAYLLYCRLAELLSSLSKQENTSASPSTTPQPSPDLLRRDSQHIIRSSPRLSGKTKQEKEWMKARSLRAYQAWCALKIALGCLHALDNLKHLSSEQHNVDISKALSSKLLSKVPDHVLLALAGCSEVVASLMRNREPPELAVLTPSFQSSTPQGLTWFSVLRHFMSLLQRSLFLAVNQQWGLHTTLLTPFFLPEARSLLALISSSCSGFSLSKCCLIPKLPAILFQLAESEDDPASMRTPSSDTSEFVEAHVHLLAAEGEVTAVWFTPDPVHAVRGAIHGLFGLNAKAIKSELNPSSAMTSGIEVHVVTADTDSLTKLHACWVELDSASSTYLSHQVTRPLSRSPSRMRHRSLEQARRATPTELQVRQFKCKTTLS